MTLHYAFPGFWWYTVAIDAVLTSTEEIIQHQLLVQGDERLLMDKEGGQSFRNSVHKGVDIRVNNLKPYAITWRDLEDLMKGLRDECFLQTCEFEFSIGNGMRIGGGALYKA